MVNGDIQNSFNAFETLRELTHCSVMNRVSPIEILLAKDLPQPVD